MKLCFVSILFSLKGPAATGKGEASDEDDDNEFFDAMEEAPEFITVPAEPHFHKCVPFRFTGRHANFVLIAVSREDRSYCCVT